MAPRYLGPVFALSLLFYYFFLVDTALAAPLSSKLAEPVCVNTAWDPFDYSVKKSRTPEETCLASLETRDLLPRQSDDDDFSCGEGRPCSNGACCPKATGWCNYGPDACGTTNTSPNDVCWSNCDAKAECGRYADPPGKTCPLNVCCGPWGYCGQTAEFCGVSEDPTTSCQNNCEQPSSGKSGSNVRNRVIGYYEAWNYQHKCMNMPLSRIPVGVLTHLFFSFAFITPVDFNIVPMDGIPDRLFSEFTALKRKNRALKVFVALGGWTHNDPGQYQTVFSDIVATPVSRRKFIVNLMTFLRQYAFDGVDFDWEYPGAEDRGGRPDDGINFTKLLQELRAEIANQPEDYQVSFTTPTSYWYLRHFDIKASSDAVDFVNVMSYDLHGVWDSWNPIGNNVLAHTNLSEIKIAFDLYWRNNIDPAKLNLGIGFYGRSFQLENPACYQPGCRFRGGAAGGPCTQSSGTLSYREIVDIIQQHNLRPYYDKENEIKYIVWNQDQWVSYDDEETINNKITWANNQGLGGLLIWSVDQDTDNYSALSAVVGVEALFRVLKNAIGDDASYWQGIGPQSCRLTECGGSCRTGEVPITKQPCGDAKGLGRHSSQADSTLCCPLASAPDPKKCHWRGRPTECNGVCHDGEVALQQNRWGDGKYCENGNKIYCCETPQGRNNDCYWTGEGGSCRAGDKPLTFAGTFLSNLADVVDWFGIVGDLLADTLDDYDMDLRRLYCCPPADLDRWKNCRWKGKPGSCFDNACDLNTQVQLTSSHFGGGQSCGWYRSERQRSFCCDPPDGEPLFPPVALDRLFPNPPTGDDVDIDFELETDNTWGDGQPDTSGGTGPENAAFAFYIIAAPDEIQVTLDKRDGSHWELFNCNDAVSEDEHTVQMICTNPSEDSNCGDIYKGHGVAGTIIQMPVGQGCGPGKYAVAKSLEVSANQTLPRHLARRGFAHNPVVYDLSFNYDFSLVPRDMGDAQLRIDFSNQEGYWDNVVADAASKKRKVKRSLDSMNRDHRRWLEEEWRDDVHLGALSPDELHKRWFGSDIAAWLHKLLDVEIKPTIRHDIDEEISVILLRERYMCDIGNVRVNAKLDAVATASIKMSTSFGFTLITRLSFPLDLSNAFLHFNNEGEIAAIFTIEALVSAAYESKVTNFVRIPFPGASFSIPGIMTLGPRLDVNGQLSAQVALSGKMEARVNVASWQIRQTFPDQGSEFDPQQIDAPRRDISVQGVQPPTFDASLQAFGYIEAHVIPTVTFGIVFHERWGIGEAAVELAADGYARLRAQSTFSTSGDGCDFAYAIDAGAKLIATAKTPAALNWDDVPVEFGRIDRNIIPGNGQEWRCLTGGGTKRSLPHNFLLVDNEVAQVVANSSSGVHNKRGDSYGPLIRLPRAGCPSRGGDQDSTPCSQIVGTSDVYEPPRDYGVSASFFSKRKLKRRSETATTTAPQLERRVPKASINVCEDNGQMTVAFPDYPAHPAGAPILDNQRWDVCENLIFGVQAQEQAGLQDHLGNSLSYQTEHALEAQAIKVFMEQFRKARDTTSRCSMMKKNGWDRVYTINGFSGKPWEYVGRAWPGTGSHENEFIRVIDTINNAKSKGWRRQSPFSLDNVIANLGESEGPDWDAVLLDIKIGIMTYKYQAHPTFNAALVAQANRVRDALQAAEDAVAADTNRNPNYVRIGLRNLWVAWIREEVDAIKVRYKNLLRNALNEVKLKLGDTEPPAGTPKSDWRVKFEQKTDALEIEVNAIYNNNVAVNWVNPF